MSVALWWVLARIAGLGRVRRGDQFRCVVSLWVTGRVPGAGRRAHYIVVIFCQQITRRAKKYPPATGASGDSVCGLVYPYNSS